MRRAFGAYLLAVVHGRETLMSGAVRMDVIEVRDPGTGLVVRNDFEFLADPVVLDLEDGTLSGSARDDFASAQRDTSFLSFFDLVDADNESLDEIDGIGSSAERLFEIVDSWTDLQPPVPSESIDYEGSYVDLVRRWDAAGYDGAALSRVLVGHGDIEDDDREANDHQDEATVYWDDRYHPLRNDDTRVLLTPFNEDWYTIDVTRDGGEFAFWLDPFFDEGEGKDFVVGMEVRTAEGEVLAQQIGVAERNSGPAGFGYLVESEALDAGTLLPAHAIRVGTGRGWLCPAACGHAPSPVRALEVRVDRRATDGAAVRVLRRGNRALQVVEDPGAFPRGSMRRAPRSPSRIRTVITFVAFSSSPACRAVRARSRPTCSSTGGASAVSSTRSNW